MVVRPIFQFKHYGMVEYITEGYGSMEANTLWQLWSIQSGERKAQEDEESEEAIADERLLCSCSERQDPSYPSSGRHSISGESREPPTGQSQASTQDGQPCGESGMGDGIWKYDVVLA